MTPQTAEEMYTILFRGMLVRLYGDMTAAARRGRLTEHDIARVERRALDFLREPEKYAAEFPDFDARSVTGAVLHEFEQMLAVIRTARVNAVSKEH